MCSALSTRFTCVGLESECMCTYSSNLNIKLLCLCLSLFLVLCEFLERSSLDFGSAHWAKMPHQLPIVGSGLSRRSNGEENLILSPKTVVTRAVFR